MLFFIRYDNILGKSNRMEVLAKSGLNTHDENTILEFCCDLSASPYNRRTRKPLSEILQFVYRMENCNHQVFDENERFAYRWWWAFCKKYSIVSLHYDNNANIKMTERNWFSSLHSIHFSHPDKKEKERKKTHTQTHTFHLNVNISYDNFISLSCLLFYDISVFASFILFVRSVLVLSSKIHLKKERTRTHNDCMLQIMSNESRLWVKNWH